MSTTPPDPADELSRLAHEYQHAPRQHILEPVKREVLLLRAKGATYETVTEALNQHEVRVSEATVRKFCHLHDVEIERLRNEMDLEASEGHSTVDVPLASIGSFEGPSANENSHQKTGAKSSIDPCSMAAASSPEAVGGVQIVEGVVHIWFPLATLRDHTKDRILVNLEKLALELEN